ncbi:class I SAM-dependent methyltransferase [Niabella aurantiaca]|uniref:class I SAM-dependent methyltransferase n=1 Tax=Niabella aurantiaca TaxID=379900 RepID=UPI000362B7F5|nr:methyltransferase domain-containing protein [Niabella aurantiaca]
MNFTAHNIRLNGQTTTMPADTPILAESVMWQAIAETVDLFFPKGREERSGMKVVDLGCLEGGYTAEFARMGFDALGIEARADNFRNCNLVKENLGLPNLNFVQDDVRNMARYGPFDISLCYGLLYHLNDPVHFLKTVADSTKKLLLLNTHFAPEHDIRYYLGPVNRYFLAPIQKRTRFLEHQKNFRLSPITLHEGYRGRWYKEWNKHANKSKVEKILWASYNNNRSFWLCKKDLTKVLHNAGFKHVFEQFNFTGDLVPDHYTSRYNRTMFVALKA